MAIGMGIPIGSRGIVLDFDTMISLVLWTFNVQKKLGCVKIIQRFDFVVQIMSSLVEELIGSLAGRTAIFI